MATGNTNFDAILSTTLKNYRDTLEDNVSSNVALWKYLTDKGNVTTEDGGASIVVQLLYGKNTTASSYAGYDVLDTTPQTGITAAEFPWAQYAATVAISGIERRKNSGQHQVVNLMKAKVQQAEITIAENFEAMLYGSGTGNSGKDFLGIGALIGNEASSVTTVGGIDATDAGNVWWRSNIDVTSAALTLADLGTNYRKTSRGPSKPDFNVTTAALFTKYESLLQPQQRFTDPKMAEAGFQNLMFQGGPVVWSDQATSGVWYMLNSKYLQLVKDSQVWLTSTPFVDPWNQDAYFSKILCYGQLVISNRKLGGCKLTNRT